MRGRHFSVYCCLLAGICAFPAMADIDPSEYELKTSVRSEKERRQLQAGFELDRQKDAALQKQEEENAARQSAARKAAWDALPYPVRLTHTRCTTCHDAGNYANQRHNRVGWELITLRMQYLNEAPLAAGDRSVIAAHLADIYPASGVAGLVQALQQIAVVLSPVWIGFAWKMIRSRFGKQC